MPKVLLGYSGGSVARKKHKRKRQRRRGGRRGRERDKSGRKLFKKWVAGIEKKARAQIGQSVKQNLDCSQIETQKRRKARDF